MTHIDPTPTASHFVDGAYLEDTAGHPIPVVYPATGKVIATVHGATPHVVETALASAQRAQADWAATDPTERGRVLRRAADLIRARNRDLSVLETLDTGKPLQETLVADATSGADALEYFGGLAVDTTGTSMQFGGDWAYTIRRPLGVCVGIGAWNYPTQIACWKGAPALATGNAMVFKPSETTPLCALKVAEILVEAGLPAGLFNVIQGQGDVGAALTTDPRVAKVSLTGSVSTGRKVYAAAAAEMKQVTMELGGKSPLIVFDDADLDSAVSGAINANFYSSGQVCSNGTRVFVQSGLRDAFLARLVERVQAATLGDPMDETTDFGPMTTEAQMEIVLAHLDRARAEGATVLTGGERLERDGYWIAPTVLTDLTDDMACVREEIFGPVMSVLTFEDEAEVIARANETVFGLSAGLFTADITRAHRVVAQLKAGTCWINQYNLTPPGMPFGGSKQSGIGRENARVAMDHFTEVQTVYVGMSPVEAAY
ncbi:NAD/NADP-dependent betaine aldehyde dehydrogenase [Jannaschia pagri]|uniref:Betaine-aldehyde dehydrogenase n=1 Tax=Jannaschia pagri TaxID=2829797 RepID=A0ABQ4NHI6_9RHOB|nr:MULTISPECIES: betaine-aldehyde dehydrogenase [unclassified Jannaschia]GIT90003.1 NAD/NADP-dependent betaine aldehyde dehydrogenase [Jannaschia sp. AI_61]GIT93891.1 NAD/NADP-dependent betaine aldehyde dehydrogenase [Jannaschia sp. AI_62]